MGHGPCAFKESDVKRAVKAALAAGLDVAGVRFTKDGGFTVIAGKPGASESEKIGGNEVEDWIAKHAH
jgi:hypothetical protein